MTLHEKALDCVGKCKRAESELIEVLMEIDRTRSYLPFGVSSLFRYCVEHLNLTEGESFRFIQVARKSNEVPELRAAVSSGILTVSRASRIAPVITVATHKKWIEKAVALTQKEMEREVARENPAALKREVLKVVSPEVSQLKICISHTLELKLKRAQEVFRTKNLVDTLEGLVDFALKHKDPIEKARRNVKHDGVWPFGGGGVNHRGVGATGKPLKLPGKTSTQVITNDSAPTSRQVITNDSAPTSRQVERGNHFGGQIRTSIPAHLKHRVFLRDQGACTFKGCKEKRWVEIHHVLPLSYGGIHSVDNLTTLCYSHHKFAHRLQKSCEIKASGT